MRMRPVLSQDRKYAIVEVFNGFNIVHLPSGESRGIGDGVDIAEGSETSIGSRRFRAALRAMVNDSEVREAYFGEEHAGLQGDNPPARPSSAWMYRAYNDGLSWAARAAKVQGRWSARLEAEVARAWRRTQGGPILPDAERAFRFGFREGYGRMNPATPKARRYVSRSIRRHVRAGMPSAQAVAVGLDQGRRAGFRSIPPAPNPEGDVFTLTVGYTKKPARFRHMNIAEIVTLRPGQRIWFLANDGTARETKVNGAVRRWKRDPFRLEVPLKYGLYEYATFDRTTALARLLVPVAENPLTRAEAAKVLRVAHARTRDARTATLRGDSYSRALNTGWADALNYVAWDYGPALHPYPHLYSRSPYGRPRSMRNPAFVEGPRPLPIRPGDRVTFLDRFGQRRTGRVVFALPTHLTLNMGGPHGTPAVCRYDQVVAVSPRRNPLTRAETATVLRRMRTAQSATQAMQRAARLHPSPGNMRELGYWRGARDEAGQIAFHFGATRRRHPTIPWALSRNPPRVVGRIPGALTEVRYNRAGRHAGPFRHPVSQRGVRMLALADGSVLLRGAAPLWGRY